MTADAIEVGSRGFGYVGTSDGSVFDIQDPKPEQLDIKLIAHALAQVNRFGGHAAWPYSVAQHSCLCAFEAEVRCPGDMTIIALLHDASEAYLGDLVRPLKRLMRSTYEPLEARLQACVYERWLGRQPAKCELELMKEIDNAVLRSESAVLMPGSEDWNWEGVAPAIARVEQWDWEYARDEFLHWAMIEKLI